MAIISSSVYAENSEILYDNGRFDPLYQVAKSSLKDAEYTDATHKIFDYLDTVNFYPCNGYQLLIDLEKKIN